LPCCPHPPHLDPLGSPGTTKGINANKNINYNLKNVLKAYFNDKNNKKATNTKNS
jgi:hypothetical protein